MKAGPSASCARQLVSYSGEQAFGPSNPLQVAGRHAHSYDLRTAMRQIPLEPKAPSTSSSNPSICEPVQGRDPAAGVRTPVMIMVMENPPSSIRAYLDPGESAVGTASTCAISRRPRLDAWLPGGRGTKVDGGKSESLSEQPRGSKEIGAARIPGLLSTWLNSRVARMSTDFDTVPGCDEFGPDAPLWVLVMGSSSAERAAPAYRDRTSR